MEFVLKSSFPRDQGTKSSSLRILQGSFPPPKKPEPFCALSGSYLKYYLSLTTSYIGLLWPTSRTAQKGGRLRGEPFPSSYLAHRSSAQSRCDWLCSDVESASPQAGLVISHSMHTPSNKHGSEKIPCSSRKIVFPGRTFHFYVCWREGA